MAVIVIKRTDGGVSIMRLLGPAAEAAELAPEHLDTIVEAEISQWPPEAQAAVASWRELPDEAIPADRTFRQAWCDVTPAPVIDLDIEKCRAIHRDRMRAARAPKLAALDIAYQRADEIADAARKREVAAAKNRLRDVTALPEIDAARTPDDLNAIWPDMLAPD